MTVKGLRGIIFAILTFLCAGCLSLNGAGDSKQQVISIDPAEGDMTPIVRTLLENRTSSNVKLVFKKGTYRFRPEQAVERFYHITNHDDGSKKIIFFADGLDSIEIEGSGSSFIFHGQCAPFIFQDCKRVALANLSIDWDIPFLFQAEILDSNAKEGWFEARPLNEGYSWRLENNHISFPNIDGFSFKELGHTYAFNPKTKDVAHGASALRLKPSKVEEKAGGILRFYQKLKEGKEPPKGAVFGSKGHVNRYAPAVYGKVSSNIFIDNVVVHHALGMGFLFERSEDITLHKGGVYLSEGTDRVISSIADATHFSNCKGDILVDGCRIENMMDDGTNVHGTHVAVEKIVDPKTLRIRLMHHQQQGNIFAEVGDEVWLIQQPSTHRGHVNKVVSVQKIDATITELTFKDPLPATTAPGDVLENKTWNPTFTLRNCHIGNHRARNLALKTPLKIIIENNDFFSSDLASILFRGEMANWFESGAVTDVLIQNNHFSLCNHGGAEQAVLYITPKHGKTFNQNEVYDRNIRFIDNVIETFDNRIVWADRAEDLLIQGNIIRQTTDYPPLHPEAPVFDFANCRNVRLIGNTLEGSYPEIIRTDATSQATLTVEGNTGF